MKAGDNLRGVMVVFNNDETGGIHRGVVITHIRDNRWMIEAPRLPLRFRRGDGSRRIILHRDDFFTEAEWIENFTD